MRDLASADRPREKLLSHGAAALGDNELVALIVGSGGRRGGALAVANALLAAHGGLHRLARSSAADLARVAGIGRAKAAQVLAAIELGRRTLAQPPGERPQIRAPRDAAALLMPAYAGRPAEHFGVVMLDTRHRVIRTTVLTMGSATATIVEPREVFREAAIAGATAVVVFHNHPSGDPSPSPDDLELTRRLVAAGILMGIEVIDHIVLGDVRYYSFKEASRI